MRCARLGIVGREVSLRPWNCPRTLVSQADDMACVVSRARSFVSTGNGRRDVGLEGSEQGSELV